MTENSIKTQENSKKMSVFVDNEGEIAEVDRLLLNIDGFEGPIDVLLELSRNQKVDIAKISILELVRQYLIFIDQAQKRNLELAAEYLVMAAWLAYLKSRIFLPKEENSDEPSAEDVAQALQFQLLRLEAMQKAADKLLELPQLGQDVFPRGQPEGLDVNTVTTWSVSLYDMLKAYGDIERRKEASLYDLPTFELMSTDNAMERLCRMLGNLPKKNGSSVWTTLHSFMPDDIEDSLYGRSTLASTFTAGLELVKQGGLEIKQDGLFRPVYMRKMHKQHLKDGDAETNNENGAH
ncbi:MAG: segregation and condensation protein A [Alphaproteobacteria bacterium]